VPCRKGLSYLRWKKILDKNYRKLAKKYHSDMNQEKHDLFKEIMRDPNNYGDDVVKDATSEFESGQ
jgi:DnaJ-class molecular chaperone